jgi:hypothetical protein
MVDFLKIHKNIKLKITENKIYKTGEKIRKN